MKKALERKCCFRKVEEHPRKWLGGSGRILPPRSFEVARGHENLPIFEKLSIIAGRTFLRANLS